MHSPPFTDLTIVQSSGAYIIAKARRYDRYWALKALKEEWRNDETHTRVFRETFERLVSLQHPHIVSVVGLEEVEGLGACIVMEWVDGLSLETWMKQKHPRRERMQIMQQIILASEYASKETGALLYLDSSDVMIVQGDVGIKILDFEVQEEEDDDWLNIIFYELELDKGYNPLGNRWSVAWTFIVLFVMCTTFSSREATADQQTIATLNARLASAQNALHEMANSKQQLSAFVEGAKRHMERSARYDLDTLNTYEACEAARKELLGELEKALTDYYATHSHPASYAYTYAKFDLMDYRREIIQPLENKRLKLLSQRSSMRKD